MIVVFLLVLWWKKRMQRKFSNPDLLKKLAETKDWKTKEREMFLKDLRELKLKHLLKSSDSINYADLESDILKHSEIKINLI